MIKADSMKVPRFMCSATSLGSYVTTVSDISSCLSVRACMVKRLGDISNDYTSTPDVIVTEVMLDGGLVYIDTLCRNRVFVSPSRKYLQ